MAWFADFTQCTYFPGDTTSLLAVGWLERAQPFTKGAVDPAVMEQLRELLTLPWSPVAFMGPHFCDLCERDAPGGHENLFIPFADRVFVAPQLVLHYIERHGYQPPARFIEAVLACPPMGSPEYLAAIDKHYRPFDGPGRRGTRAG